MTLPTSIPMPRTRRTWPFVAAVALATGTALAVVFFAMGTSGNSAGRSTETRSSALASLSPTERQYVQSITSLNPAQLAAGFGTGRVAGKRPSAVATIGSHWESYGPSVPGSLSPEARQSVASILALTHAQLVAAFGTPTR